MPLSVQHPSCYLQTTGQNLTKLAAFPVWEGSARATLFFISLCLLVKGFCDGMPLTRQSSLFLSHLL